MQTVVVIVGRPNVGKSTLFNRLTGKTNAIVHDEPGVTRDRREAEASLGPLTFTLMDTAGLTTMERKKSDILEQTMQKQTERALKNADIILFMIDGRAGLTSEDEGFSNWLHRKGKTVIPVINKCEGKIAATLSDDVTALGFGEPAMISAEHGEGLMLLHDRMLPHMPNENPDALDIDDKKDGPIRIAIIGRPNAGKSTFMNALLGEERVITSPIAGTTRDAVYIRWQYNDTPILLTDTAGLRRRSKVQETVEKLSLEDAMKALQYCNVAILVIDAMEPLDHQDLSLGDHILQEGRGLVIAVNKWDKAKDPSQLLNDIRGKLEDSLPQAGKVPLVTISALQGKNVTKVMDVALKVYEHWNSRIPTAKLNLWLREAVDYHTPPMVSGRRLKLRYMTQTKRRPPTFVLFVSQKKDFPQDYVRYLQGSLREHFSLEGVPLRLHLRKAKNPYSDDTPHV